MRRASAPRHGEASAAAVIRARIRRGGERLWRFEDFRDLPGPSVAQTLSRLCRSGVIERLSKGVYYRGRPTSIGRSQPNPADLTRLAAKGRLVYPSGVAGANLLGFTTQAPASAEVATTALSMPRKLLGEHAIVHTRRPEVWANLSEADGALLEFLRRGGRTSELSPAETVEQTLALLAEPGRFRRLLSVYKSEPPRVRALLGALGEQLGRPARELEKLHASLNPLSRFDFGVFSDLPNARTWLAKERR